MLHFYLYVLLVLIAFYTIGASIFYLLRIKISDTYTSLFSGLFTGCILFVLLYSFIQTKFNTVHLGFVILLIPLVKYYMQNRPDKKSSWVEYFRLPVSTIAVLLILSLSLFVFSAWFLYDTASGMEVPPFTDYIYYSSVSDYFNTTGIENSYTDYVYTSSNVPMPYHYFEIWFDALGSRTTGDLSIYIQQLVVHVIFNLLIVTGMCAIAEKFIRNRYLSLLLSILFLFFNGIAWGVSGGYETAAGLFTNNVMVMPRYAPVYLFIISALLFALNEKPEFSLIALLTLPIVSISTAAPVLIAVFIFPLIFRKSKWLGGIKLFPMLYAGLTGLFIVLFYYFNHNFDIAKNYPGTMQLQLGRLDGQLMERFNVILRLLVSTPVLLLYIYAPFAIPGLWFLFKRRENVKPFLFFALLCICIVFISILTWIFLNRMVESSQLCSNITVPLLNVLLFATGLYAYSVLTGKQARIIVVAIFLIFGSVNIVQSVNYLNAVKQSYLNTYSPEYVKEVKQALLNAGNKGAYLAGKEDFRSELGIDLSIYAYRDHLCFVKNGISIMPLNTIEEIPLSDDPDIRLQAENKISSYVFTRFLNEQKLKELFNSVAQSRVDFIHQQHIDFMFITENTKLDSLLKMEVKKVIIDKKSGEGLLLVR